LATNQKNVKMGGGMKDEEGESKEGTERVDMRRRKKFD